jgi:hypothetical protein
MKARNEMIVCGSKFRERTNAAFLCIGVMVLAASMAGCIANDTDQATTKPGNDEASTADQGALADIGDHQIDPGDSDATSDSPTYVRFWYTGGRNGNFVCQPGYHHGTSFGSNPPWPTEATNHCGLRTYLYQNADFTGPTLCLSPFSHTGVLHSTWRAFRTTGNSTRCN